jgi:hypothetical protein
MPAQGVVDALTNTYTDIAKMKLLPDAQAHMQFLNGLEQGIMSYIQMQANATLQAPGGGAAGIGGMGGGIARGAGALPPGMGPSAVPPGGLPGGPPGGPAGPPPGPGPMSIAPGGGAGMSGLMTRPNPADLQRLLAARGGPG